MKTKNQNFLGFDSPTSNTTYTPNQFFDLVLPNFSRSLIRIVAFMIRKTLGWCDENGNPQEPLVNLSYKRLQREMKMDRKTIKPAIEKAIENNFISEIYKGHGDKKNVKAHDSIYELKWSNLLEYKKNLEDFDGFFAFEGNRTNVPNQYFDIVIPDETLGVVKVVGLIVRNTIGWKNKYGFRRTSNSIAYSRFKQVMNIHDEALSKAIKISLKKNYIELVEAGTFIKGCKGKSAKYKLKWFNDNAENKTEWKNRSEESPINRVEKSKPDRVEKSKPDYLQTEWKNRSNKIKQQINKTTNKTKNNVVVDFKNDLKKEEKKLIEFGITPSVAKNLIQAYPENVKIWIEAINFENKSKIESVGFLVNAIKNNWQPKKTYLETKTREEREKNLQAKQEKEEKIKKAIKQKEIERWDKLPIEQKLQELLDKWKSYIRFKTPDFNINNPEFIVYLTRHLEAGNEKENFFDVINKYIQNNNPNSNGDHEGQYHDYLDEKNKAFEIYKSTLNRERIKNFENQAKYKLEEKHGKVEKLNTILQPIFNKYLKKEMEKLQESSFIFPDFNTWVQERRAG